MYIRLKIFDKKSIGTSQKPLFFYEINGNSAIELMIISVTKEFFGEQKGEKIRDILRGN